MFSGRQFVMCKTDVTFWHVANVGTQSDFLSVYFTGNLFQYQGLFQSVLTLFPMTGMTISMESEVIGETELEFFHLFTPGIIMRCEQSLIGSILEVVWHLASSAGLIYYG